MELAVVLAAQQLADSSMVEGGPSEGSYPGGGKSSGDFGGGGLRLYCERM